MDVSRGRTAVTLTVLGVLFVLMAVVGFQRLTAPFPAVGSTTSTPTCQVYKERKQVVRREIQVSVYNRTQRAGLAERTMTAFEKRNFRVGAIGNAPDDASNVDFVEVRTTVRDDPRAQLVAQQFKPKASIVESDEALGPGIDVILGPKYKKLAAGAPTTYKLPTPERTCVDRATPKPSS